jgi:polar amino acid transport system ATP-binding protein
VATNDKLIQVRNLKKYYNKGQLHALDDVTTDIYQQEVVVIIAVTAVKELT